MSVTSATVLSSSPNPLTLVNISAVVKSSASYRAEGLLDLAVFLRDGRIAEAVRTPDGVRASYRAVMSGRVRPEGA